MTDYPAGTVAIATVKNVQNVKVFKRDTSAGGDWAFSPVRELGLDVTCANLNDVRDIVVLDSSPLPTPVRAPYDISKLNATGLEAALVEILGEGEESGDDYYEEFTGINAFYHMLAGTANGNQTKLPECVEVTSKGLNVPGLGEFITVDKVTEYMAESGDADTFVVFEFNGKTYKKQSYLDSYEGGVWDGVLHEVKPRETTVIVWDTV